MVEHMLWGFLIFFFFMYFFCVNFFNMQCKYTGSDMNVAKSIEEGLSFNAI